MAITYYQIDTTKRLGAKLRQTVDLQNLALDNLADVKTVMDKMIDGADYSALETNFGLAAGQGLAVYTLVVNALAVINVLTVTNFINQLG